MKSTIISMIIVLCVMATVPMLLFSDNDLLARFGLNIFGGPGEPKVPKNLTNVTTDQKVQVYKWRDEHGVMQFTNTPPPETSQAELVELTPNTNIVKAIEVPEDEPEQAGGGPRVMSVGNPYTPGGMKELVDTTSSLAESMNQKQLEQQKLMEQIMGNQK
ncbi:MAG: DUF4124 domain-containing protein [Gammaproteobacteria bacterium]|nr:DUF4124 domain-containing protein [Gammaproteobacteria bacterium]